MDVSTITAIISNVGFPIVCVILMAQYINTTVKEMNQAINNNTKALEKILTLLRIDDDK